MNLYKYVSYSQIVFKKMHACTCILVTITRILDECVHIEYHNHYVVFNMKVDVSWSYGRALGPEGNFELLSRYFELKCQNC